MPMEVVLNQYCAVCGLAHNSINGRYCREYSMYVTYMKEPLCDKEKFNGRIQDYSQAEVM